MPEHITITGTVGTVPTCRTTSRGDVTSFRLAANQRRFDRATNAWVDAGTNWYSVSAWRQLGVNAAASLSKGDRVIVSGTVRVNDYAREDGSRGIAIDVTADAIGHDLSVGTTTVRRTNFDRRSEAPSEFAPDEGEHSASSPTDGGNAGTPRVPDDARELVGVVAHPKGDATDDSETAATWANPGALVEAPF